MFLLPKVQNKASTSSMFLTKFICSQPILLFQFVDVSHFSLSMEFLKLKNTQKFLYSNVHGAISLFRTKGEQ